MYNMQNKDIQDLNDVYISAIRYSFGRITYIPDLVTKYIMCHSDTLTDRGLDVMIRDVGHELETAEKYKAYFGEIERKTWTEFHRWMLQEQRNRRIKEREGLATAANQ